MPTDRGGQIGLAGLVGVEAGDGVDALAGLAFAGEFAAAVTRMARRAWGKEIPPNWYPMAQVLIERDSHLPCPEAEAVCWTGLSRQGSAASWLWAVGWLVLITAM
ncbi:hypothetical protein ABT275_41670 [Streptomyces sp. NPDC001185]|uniref:hypothetical protein n=1 Tax=Streptomyces sp. NPDC001185 TaxID=3154380 RepID=UPI00332FA7BC